MSTTRTWALTLTIAPGCGSSLLVCDGGHPGAEDPDLPLLDALLYRSPTLALDLTTNYLCKLLLNLNPQPTLPLALTVCHSQASEYKAHQMEALLYVNRRTKAFTAWHKGTKADTIRKQDPNPNPNPNNWHWLST